MPAACVKFHTSGGRDRNCDCLNSAQLNCVFLSSETKLVLSPSFLVWGSPADSFNVHTSFHADLPPRRPLVEGEVCAANTRDHGAAIVRWPSPALRL